MYKLQEEEIKTAMSTDEYSEFEHWAERVMERYNLLTGSYYRMESPEAAAALIAWEIYRATQGDRNTSEQR